MVGKNRPTGVLQELMGTGYVSVTRRLLFNPQHFQLNISRAADNVKDHRLKLWESHCQLECTKNDPDRPIICSETKKGCNSESPKIP